MLKVLVNNEEILCDKNIIIEEELLKATRTILRNCYPKSWEGDDNFLNNSLNAPLGIMDRHDFSEDFYYPEDFSICKIIKYDNENEELVFSGVVRNTGNISLNPRYPKYCDIEVIDFKTFLSECELEPFVIVDMTYYEAISMVVDNIAHLGFRLGWIISERINEKSPTFSTVKQSAYDVLNYYANLLNAVWFTKTIDENMVEINMYQINWLPTANPILYNREWFCENNVIDFSFNYESRDYRNKQVITSEKVVSTVEQVYYDETYSKEHKYILPDEVGRIGSILMSGQEATFASEFEKETGIVADFYYEEGSNIITSENNLPPHYTLEIHYFALTRGRAVNYDDYEILNKSAKTNRQNFVVSRYENRNEVKDTQLLSNISATYLECKGITNIQLELVTKNKNLYNIGDKMWFDAMQLLNGRLNAGYILTKKQTEIISIRNTHHFFYTYTFSQNALGEAQISYFDNQRAKSNIETGKFIQKDIDYKGKCTVIFDNIRMERR